MTSRSPGKQAAPKMRLTEGHPQRTQENDWRLFLRLVPYARRSKGPLFIAITLLIPLSVASAIQPLIVGQVISLIPSRRANLVFPIRALCLTEHQYSDHYTTINHTNPVSLCWDSGIRGGEDRSENHCCYPGRPI